MDMFSSIADRVDPFKDYLDFRFTQKLSKRVDGSSSIEDKVLPFDVLRAEMFYQTQSDICHQNNLCVDLPKKLQLHFWLSLESSQRQHILICQVLEANTAKLQSLTTSVLPGLTKKRVTVFLNQIMPGRLTVLRCMAQFGWIALLLRE